MTNIQISPIEEIVLSALYPNALEQSRRLKPEIPPIGIDNVPLRDEIELEIKL